MDFKEATDRALATCVTLEDVAAEVGVDPTTIRRARMDPTKEHSRNPPPGWEAALVKLARSRAAQLLRLAEELLGTSVRHEERKELAMDAFSFGLRLMYSIHEFSDAPLAADPPDPWGALREVAEGRLALGDHGAMMARFPGGAHIIAEAANKLVARDRELAALLWETLGDEMDRMAEQPPEEPG